MNWFNYFYMGLRQDVGIRPSRKRATRAAVIAHGFTLIELMTTLVVAAILTTIAVPSYRYFIESGRLTAATNDFVGAVTYARVEAMKRNGGPTGSGQVVVCASTDSSTCAASPATWASGWIVFWDQNADGACCNTASGDARLKAHDALASNMTVVTNPASTNKLTFNRIGAITTSLTSLKINSTSINQDRVICLSGGTGRAMVAANNNTSSCP